MGMSAAISTQKESTLLKDVHDRKYPIIFKGVETPPFFWDPGFWGLAVINNHTPEGIGVLKRCPRKLKACFLFNRQHLLLLLPPELHRQDLHSAGDAPSQRRRLAL